MESLIALISVIIMLISGFFSGVLEGAERGADPEQTTDSEVEEVNELRMKIGDTAVDVDWEDNGSVEALRELCADGALTVDMSMYGGFEQVGSLGTGIVRDDTQTLTEAGDIVLYSGDRIVVFYGSNSWAYTRLGHIRDKSAEELAALLGRGDVTITLYLEGQI